jgi:hypothetical protein
VVPRATAADSATSAQDAAHAATSDSAGKLGTFGPDAFVQGGGRTFQVAKTIAAGSSSPALDLGSFAQITGFSCSASADFSFVVSNNTNVTLDSDVAVIQNAANPATGGAAIPPGTEIASVSNGVFQQYHVLAMWPSGSAEHVGEFTLGAYHTGTSSCTLLVSGYVR